MLSSLITLLKRVTALRAEMAESLSDRLLGNTEQAEVINKVLAGVKETFAGSGIDQAVITRLERLWVSKLLDNQEEAWVPGGKEEVFKKEQQVGKQQGKQVGKQLGKERGSTSKKKDNTSKMAGTISKEDLPPKEGSGEKEKASDGKKTGPTPKLGKVKKTIKERWESIPNKGTNGMKEAEVKLKENEVKIMSAEEKVSRKKVEEGAQEEAIIQLDGNAEPNESSEEDDDEDLGLGEDSDDDSD